MSMNEQEAMSLSPQSWLFDEDPIREATEICNVMPALMHNAGWKALVTILQDKNKMLLQSMLDPGLELPDTSLREMRMAMQNLNLLITLPQTLLDGAEAIIQHHRANNPGEDIEEGLGDDGAVQRQFDDMFGLGEGEAPVP